MSIAGSGRSRIVMVAGVPPDPDAWTFQVRTKRVGKDGNVYIEAQDADGTVLKVRGQGKGKRGAAHITAEVELWGAKEYGPSTFRAVFHSRSSGYLAALKSLISKAESRLPESR
jgi:hypothetical protein